MSPGYWAATSPQLPLTAGPGENVIGYGSGVTTTHSVPEISTIGAEIGADGIVVVVGGGSVVVVVGAAVITATGATTGAVETGAATGEAKSMTKKANREIIVGSLARLRQQHL